MLRIPFWVVTLMVFFAASKPMPQRLAKDSGDSWEVLVEEDVTETLYPHGKVREEIWVN